MIMGAKEAKDPKKGSVVANVNSIYWSRTFVLFPRRTQQRSSEKKKVFDELKK